ncbi:hypothetical protein T07_11440 [Trichinella nelsoni]|uniref:Uncharacterized protein n=1 Tax=Trichinella nelsoni TaxID=6336 RepID=A0A0V0S9M3_9BILA|nr:hypothetical protein T07_11440 [Trichinella nelsoni]
MQIAIASLLLSEILQFSRKTMKCKNGLNGYQSIRNNERGTTRRGSGGTALLISRDTAKTLGS